MLRRGLVLAYRRPRDTLKPYNKSPPEDKMHLEDWVEETIEEFLLEYVGD
jgi:hypothetical protein